MPASSSQTWPRIAPAEKKIVAHNFPRGQPRMEQKPIKVEKESSAKISFDLYKTASLFNKVN